METYKFTAIWKFDIEVEALSESQAWHLVQNDLSDAFDNNKGDLTIDLVEEEDIDVWRAFSTYPEEPNITSLAIDDSEYL